MEDSYHSLTSSADDFFFGTSRFDGQLGSPLPLAYAVLLVCRAGSAEWEVNFQPCQLKAGDFLILGEYSVALIKRKSEDFACACYLLKRPMAAEVIDGFPNSLLSFLHRFPLFSPGKDSAAFLAAWESQLNIMYGQGGRRRRTMIVNHFQNLLLWISEKSGSHEAGARSEHTRPEAICWRFWELVGVHCRRQREVAFYAGLLHVTPYYLSQLTRKFFSDSPKTLIDRQVVLEIKKRLAIPRKSVQQIADELHFADASYLGKYFKRNTGMGLSEHRNSRP